MSKRTSGREGAAPSTNSGRPAVQAAMTPRIRFTDIADRLRLEIVRGELAPGAVLPDRQRMRKRYAVSNATMQRAVDILLRDGFLEAKAGVGTRVVAHPPCAAVFAISVPWPLFGHRSLFWAALREAVARWPQTDTCQVRLYEGGVTSKDQQDAELELDVRSHRVAGVFFGNSPERLSGSAALIEPHVARALWASAPDPDGRIPAAFFFDYRSFLTRAAELMFAAQRRRIAVVGSVIQQNPPLERHLESVLAAMGAQCPPKWRQSIPAGRDKCAHYLIPLLMDPDNPRRPDGLVVMDDNIVESVSEGLLAARVRVPEDVFVVSHANFPTPPPALLPVARVGLDVQELLKRAIASLMDQTLGRKAARSLTLLPAVKEADCGSGSRE